MWDIITKSEKYAAEQLSSEKVRTHHNTVDEFQIFVPPCMIWYSKACFSSDHHSNLSFGTESFAEVHLT